MAHEPFERKIPITQLRLDSQNPRLPKVKKGQTDTLLTMVDTQRDKMIALARHIVENGPNPASLLVVMPSQEEDEAFVVLDGNRRVAALELLKEPSSAQGVLSAGAVTSLRELSARFLSDPVTKLSCVVVADRDEADTWIPLIHRGEQKGAGIVEWDGQVAARYDERKGTRSAALQVLDYIRERAALSQKTLERIESGRFPITNLSRLLDTPDVRNKLGIEKEGDKVVTHYPDEEVLKGLARVVEDIGSGGVTVSHIKSQQQRIDYVRGFESADLPNPATRMDTAAPLGERVSGKGPKARETPGKSVAPVERTRLIPKGCKLSIKQPKINRLYHELRRLPLGQYPNAGAVLLRVFLELSVDHYLEGAAGWPEPKIQNSFLKDKLHGAAKHLEQTGAMTKAQLRPVRQAAGGQTLLASSVKTMHGYVHSRYFSARASELIGAWDDLQPFVENLWSAR